MSFSQVYQISGLRCVVGRISGPTLFLKLYSVVNNISRSVSRVDWISGLKYSVGLIYRLVNKAGLYSEASESEGWNSMSVLWGDWLSGFKYSVDRIHRLVNKAGLYSEASKSVGCTGIVCQFMRRLVLRL